MLESYQKSPLKGSCRGGMIRSSVHPKHHFEDLLFEHHLGIQDCLSRERYYYLHTLRDCQDKRSSVRVTKMSVKDWKHLNGLRKFEARLKEELRKLEDLAEIARKKVDEDDAVENLEKEKLETASSVGERQCRDPRRSCKDEGECKREEEADVALTAVRG